MIHFNIDTILLLILSVELFALIIIFLNNTKVKVFSDEEYIVALKNLEFIINVYKESFINAKIESMKRTFDLNPESATNASKAFQEKLNLLYADSAKDFFNRFINKSHKNVLLTYFTSDSLVLTIITLLKKVEL